MAQANCRRCGEPIIEGRAVQVSGMDYCPTCVVKSGREKELVDPAKMREILERGFDRIIDGENEDEVYTSMVKQIERAVGVAAFHALLSAVESLGEEMRQVARRLGIT